MEQTDAFKAQYRKRSGHESCFGGMKRRLGLGRLRVRGSPGVTLSCLLKITGWNVLRASASPRMAAEIEKMVLAALRGSLSAFFKLFALLFAARRAPATPITPVQAVRPRWPGFFSGPVAPAMAL